MWIENVEIINSFPHEKMTIRFDRQIDIGDVFVIEGRMFSVVDEGDACLNCVEVEKILEAEKI